MTAIEILTQNIADASARLARGEISSREAHEQIDIFAEMIGHIAKTRLTKGN